MIKVERMKVWESGSTLAHFSVSLEIYMKIGEKKIKDYLSVNDCRLVERNKGKFIAMPQKKYEKNGETKYANYVFLKGEDIMAGIRSAAINEYNRQTGNYEGESGHNHEDDFPF